MNILFVNSTVRENSRTYVLACYLLEKLKKCYEQSNIEFINLSDENIQPLNKESLALRDELIQTKNYNHSMFKYAKQFNQADIIIVAAPYWDLSFPAVLKNYLEQIAVQGINFEYIHGIPNPLCDIKKLFYVSTSGGPMSDAFSFNYLKTLAESFYGIKENIFFKAEFMDIRNADVNAILTNAKKEIDNYFN